MYALGASTGVFQLLQLVATAGDTAVQRTGLLNTNCWLSDLTFNMLFKKDNRMNCDHYKGINIMGTFVKIYTLSPSHEMAFTWQQKADAQPKRSCQERTMTVWLLFDYCVLKCTQQIRLWRCNANGISCDVQITKSIRNLAAVVVTVCVRQGSPPSSFLVTMYVNTLTCILEGCSGDGFLGLLWLLYTSFSSVVWTVGGRTLRGCPTKRALSAMHKHGG